MGFFRNALRSRDKQGSISTPQDRHGAGRQAVEDAYTLPRQVFQHQQTYTSTVPSEQSAQQHGGMTKTIRTAFPPHGHEDDFDDAASYHSTSSNPGVTQPTAALANNATYTPALASRYANISNHSHISSWSASKDNAGNYSASIDEGFFHLPGSIPEASLVQPALGRHPSEQNALSSNTNTHGLSPTSPNSVGRSFAMQERQSDKRPSSAQEQGEEYFQKAVGFHEEGDLVSATGYFKRAANKQNPLGMLFYGLSLRHGWGCQPNEHMAFIFLQKAGEIVVPHVKDMDPTVAGMAREELAMAIYELGQSYRHGWGVSRNKKTAAYYFEVAADLGDADAQADLAACYEKGDGVKRDMKQAAHYYRLAHKQGVELFGTSWIFKKKYD
ncbi:HCP-like protein [Coemansia reversa NRRL 1564]|uniref:HCP-like protein n=1 Tax=Coemansia reversa (strain ATCC 12441 / NRRL 1564) TaxID=763665 RepID=A0A2G5B606_COERN|nr:HCP-like protein [Coemansia reversa NRRL 1564]|eukprot:PIA14440.1 HCP-like protein [Coemansia reversa NRRL 1564]